MHSHSFVASDPFMEDLLKNITFYFMAVKSINPLGNDELFLDDILFHFRKVFVFFV